MTVPDPLPAGRPVDAVLESEGGRRTDLVFWLAMGWLVLLTLAAILKNEAKARSAYEAAVKASGNEAAKRALERLDKGVR